MWDEILTSLDDARAAVMMTAIDYAKAFNRLSFQHCLEAFARKGTSTELVRILANFLSNRTMSVKVNSTWSTPLPVYGGVPLFFFFFFFFFFGFGLVGWAVLLG